MGLLMGCSRPYWIGILKKIYKTYGNDKWSWNDIRTTFPEISNSDMRRLNCSNWFVFSGKGSAKKGNNNVKTSMWRLQPDAIRLAQMEDKPKSVGKKKVGR
jgi:hypothetical protein